MDLRLKFVPGARSVQVARRAVDSLPPEVDPAAREDLKMLLSELLTCAVARNAGTIQLELKVEADGSVRGQMRGIDLPDAGCARDWAQKLIGSVATGLELSAEGPLTVTFAARQRSEQPVGQGAEVATGRPSGHSS